MSFEFDYALGGLKRMQIYAIFIYGIPLIRHPLFEMVRSQVFFMRAFFGGKPQVGKRIEVDTLTSHFSVAIARFFCIAKDEKTPKYGGFPSLLCRVHTPNFWLICYTRILTIVGIRGSLRFPFTRGIRRGAWLVFPRIFRQNLTAQSCWQSTLGRWNLSNFGEVVFPGLFVRGKLRCFRFREFVRFIVREDWGICEGCPQ